MSNNNAKQKTNKIQTRKKTKRNLKKKKKKKSKKEQSMGKPMGFTGNFGTCFEGPKFFLRYLIYARLYISCCDWTSLSTYKPSHILTWQNSIWNWKGVGFCLVQLFQTNSESCLIDVLKKKSYNNNYKN